MTQDAAGGLIAHGARPLLEVVADRRRRAAPSATRWVVDPLGRLGERLRPQGLADGCARRSPCVTTPACSSSPQVAGDGRLGDAEAARSPPPTVALAAAEPLDDVAAERMGQGLEWIISHFANYMV